jgi:secreted trypsin-like serine protease
MQRIAPILFLSSLTLSTASASPPPVIGGTSVAPGVWPDVVAVIGTSGSCTGTLIAPDVVLTAGHCVEIEPKLVITNTVDYATTAGDRVPVKWARAYPDWEHRYDVAVLVLDHVAKPKPRPIATACLANAYLGARRQVEVVGFGLTSPSATDDNTTLRRAELPVLDPQCGLDPSCERSVIPNGEFTAGGRGSDSCFGDSGGPAMLATRHGPALVGVVSRGLALPGAPCGNGGVYVRADKVVSWVQSVTGRRLDRAACEGQGDDPETEETEGDEGGGCSAGGGVDVGLGVLLAAGVWRRRRRTSAQPR